MAKTLEQLKAENAASEQTEVITTETTIPEQVEEVEEQEVEADNVTDETIDPGEEQEVKPVEAWMQSEEEHDDATVPVSVLAKTRSKLKAKVGEKDTEIEKLRAEIEAMKNGQQVNQPQQQSNQLPARPTREQFDYDDDAYDLAVDDWQMKRFQSHQTQSQQQAQATNQQQTTLDVIKKSASEHYQRAEKLVESGAISADEYINADNSVRTVFENQFPGQGDSIADAVISQLATVGDGSEKVMYYLGKNPSALNLLRDKLAKDGTGMQAMAYLGSLQAKVTSAPTKKISQAPKPGSKLQGEGSASIASSPMKKQYQAAHKAKNSQQAFSIKRDARQKGINTSDW